jgi:hypothetical protein
MFSDSTGCCDQSYQLFFAVRNHEPGRREEREAGDTAEPVPAAGARGDDGGGRSRQGRRLVDAELVRVVGRREPGRRVIDDGDRRVHAVPDVLHGSEEGLPHLHQLQAALPGGPPPRRGRRRGRRRRPRRQETRQGQVKAKEEKTARRAGGAVDAHTDS